MRALALLPFVALAACTGAEDETDTDTTDTVDTDTADTDEPDPVAYLEGDVTDESGTAIAGARVNFCRQICVTVETDAQGHYKADVSPQTGSFYVREESALLDAIVPLTTVEDETRTVDVTLFAADGTATIPATAEEVELAPGLRVVVGEDTLEPALFEELGTTIAAAEVTEAEMMPVEVADPHGAFVTAFYLAPFEATSEAGLPYTIDNVYGLAPDTALVAFAASAPDQYTWLPAGELVVSNDGSVIEGGSLPILTTLVVFVAPE